MAPCKRRRGNTCAAAAAAETPIAWTLPAELMLEIVARSDPGTLVRFAATCKLLRRDIVCPSFLRRDDVGRQAAPCILAYLRTYSGNPATLVHPSTAVAASFFRDHLWRVMARKKAVSLLEEYRPVASRRGLVLLLRRNLRNRPKSKRCSDVCVYDPMTGARTFLSRPPDIKRNTERYHEHEYVLLTAADGIGCSFMLLAADFYGRRITVQTASPCGTWGPLTYVEDEDRWWTFVTQYRDPAVLRGGVIHWLASQQQILSYNLGTGKTSSVKLPPTARKVKELLLATSSDGEVLKLIGIKGFVISVWLQLPVSAGSAGWAPEAVIDMEEKFRLMDPTFPPGGPDLPIVFQGFGKRTGDVVLLRMPRFSFYELIILDLKTKDMHMQKCDGQFLEIDLASRLQNTKIFS
ncbi:hypothetical protein QYE76_019401 [Lolium multiflorum]|uniref:DUF7595 domain-containing protein n=1 Tax=Lolium multiflorum TaxID=4521 RepID=A0AAD8R5N5_LOLMU|nr:hypothetical protein QYE76_019401 [Lolium multiflorum]